MQEPQALSTEQAQWLKEVYKGQPKTERPIEAGLPSPAGGINKKDSLESPSLGFK